MLVRYRAPKDAIVWLRKVFGFEVRSIARTLDDEFAYAHLACDGTLIKVMTTAEGTRDTAASDRSYTLVVADVEAHFKRTKAAGAHIVDELLPSECSGRTYACRDLEGHTWRFAARDLETRKNLPVLVAQRQTRSIRSIWRSGIALALALTIVAAGAVFWQLRTPMAPSPHPDTVALAMTKETLRQAQALLEEERTARETAEASERRTQVEHAGLQARLDEAQATIARLETEIASMSPRRTSAQDAHEAVAAEEDWETTHVRADAAAGTVATLRRSGHPLLADGYSALASGDVAGARRRFRSLAEQGLPEAALALGSTYDPVNARGGDADTVADRERAKHWYRRAIELAQAATGGPQP